MLFSFPSSMTKAVPYTDWLQSIGPFLCKSPWQSVKLMLIALEQSEPSFGVNVNSNPNSTHKWYDTRMWEDHSPNQQMGDTRKWRWIEMWAAKVTNEYLLHLPISATHLTKWAIIIHRSRTWNTVYSWGLKGL